MSNETGRGPGRPRVAQHWRLALRRLDANEPDLTAQEIAARLSAEAEAMDRSDAPSESWIRKERRAFGGLDPDDREQYRYVHWPESFGTDELPWASAAALLPELRWLRALHARPSVRWASWFWRISLSAPAAVDLAQTRYLTGVMAALEVLELLGGDSAATWRKVEDRLVSDKPSEEAITVPIPADVDDDVLVAVLTELSPGLPHHLAVQSAELQLAIMEFGGMEAAVPHLNARAAERRADRGAAIDDEIGSDPQQGERQ